jgi:hypothetical protein
VIIRHNNHPEFHHFLRCPVAKFATHKIKLSNEGIAATAGGEIPQITPAENQ